MQLPVTQVAKQLGVNPATVRDMCREDRVPSTKIPDQHHRKYGIWLVDPEDVKRYWQQLAQRFECKVLSPTDAAYLAGLFDGEGCFTAFITRRKIRYTNRYNGHKYDGESWSTIYYIQVLITEEEPIRWLKEVTGLGYVFKRNRQKEGYQDLWGWRVNSTPACEVVQQILPYLKIKHRHAEIFLELRKRILTMKNYRQGKDYNAGMPEEEYLARQKLIDEIHRLNKRTGKVQRRYSVETTQVNSKRNPDRLDAYNKTTTSA
jgi:hypothetical protein